MKCCLMLTGICCLLAAAAAQGFNRGLPDLPPPFHNQFRRQLNEQEHHHHQHQHQLLSRQVHQQQFFSPSTDFTTSQQRARQVAPLRFPSGPGPNNFQQNNQFTRSAQNQIFNPQQQQQQFQPSAAQPTANVDLHTQNFLDLRNFANQQLGPQQSLPQRSFSNKPFQPPQQPAYSTLPASVYQQQQQPQQQQQQFPIGPQLLPQTQQKPPSQAPVPTFQTQTSPQRPFSTAPQFSFQPQPGSQQQQQQQQQARLQQQQLHSPHQHLPLQNPTQQTPTQYQLTPNLGLPVPQLFPSQQTLSNNNGNGFAQTQQQQFLTQSQQQQQQAFVQQQQYPVQTQADQEYKQKLIQKHEQFVQKQYEKSQNKVRQQHEEFLAKQQAIKQQLLPSILSSHQQQQQHYEHPNNIGTRGRPVNSAELSLFSTALQKHYQEHPTTSTTTTTTTSTTTTEPALAKNYYAQIKTESGKYGQKTVGKKPVKTIARDDLLKQLKAALAEAPQKELGNKTYDEMDLVLPNGQHVQVIRTTDPNLIKGQQAFSQDQLQTLLAQQALEGAGKLSISDVAPESTKDLVLPNGGKVQILRSPNPQEVMDPSLLPGGADLSNLASLYGGEFAGISNGANSIASSAVIQSDSDEPPTLEELAKRGLIPDGYEIEGLSSNSKPAPAAKPAATLPQAAKKKATYVYLEEQADGSFKIQGVKANGEKETKQTGAEVESILERIRSGEIKLPPSVSRLTLPNDEVVEIKSGRIIKTTSAPETSSTSSSTSTTTTTTTTVSPFARIGNSQRQSYGTRSTTSAPIVQRSSTVNYYRTTPAPVYTATPTNSVSYGTSTHIPVTERLVKKPTQTQDNLSYTDALVQESEQNSKSSEPNSANPSEDLIQILKTNGLFAMAKYLRQSGLDSILNETGPYTIFVPTDKAFKNLLVQLGGPERAEDKFKANPRLLSGLLLHHVIPGAFEIATLQDEMTGVSLAGTQLRVNQYTMHDQEWNDVTLTTINGAMVVLNKKDIKIPQGVAHAVDRVMFPLPVGDLLQTLQSDRENRFSNFLKVLYTSGLSEKLQSKGIKTYTVFAPTDKSFNDIDADLLEKLYNDKEVAEEFAMKHIVPGSLFSAGMRFYQVKDSLQTGKTVILQKTSAGKIKVNDAQMITSNIPATNGVIHAIDGVLA